MQSIRTRLHALVVGLGAFGCSSLPTPPEPLPILDPRYPADATLDYRPRRVFAHAAVPIFDVERGHYVGGGRVWVKGDAGLGSVRIEGGDALELEPPFYTATLPAEPGRRTVVFGDDVARIDVEVPGPDDLAARRARFSILAYGCFDPFDVDATGTFVAPGNGTDARFERGEGPYARFPAIRRALADVATGERTDLGPAALLVGAGDQVYVEAAHDRYGALGSAHPLCAWTVEQRPQPRLGLSAFTSFLDRTYRANWSFDPLDVAFRSIPSVMMWDDHEIRDGWGSQGDEHIFRDTYYRAAREAYLAHQQTRGPQPIDPRADSTMRSTHQSLVVHGVPVFVLDERSARDLTIPTVLGEAQSDAFRAWLRGLDPSTVDTCVIVSPLPMLFRISELAKYAGNFGPEVWDDLTDAWNSDTNVDELDAWMSELVRLYERGVRPVIVSGDIHNSAVLRAWRTPEGGGEPEVFAHEIIASGLASTIDGGGWKELLGREGALLPATVTLDGATMSAEMGVSRAVPNFAALEFDGGALRARLVQALPEGLIEVAVPLVYGPEAPAFGGLVHERPWETAGDRGSRVRR